VAKPTNGSTETTQTNINICITTACTTEKIFLKHGKKQCTISDTECVGNPNTVSLFKAITI